MTNLEELKRTYIQDADAMASKSRFGFFSIPPSVKTGLTEYEQKKGISIIM